MALLGDNWMRVFDIPDTSKHIKGFTLYKIVSIVYPKTCPDAVTKVTVWKRYNDFKKLHRELKDRYKCMQISEKYPTLVSCSYFKRFDTEVIHQRRNSALAFLEFVAQHPPLFKSIEFVKFFESSHTPQEALNSNINIIRAQLNLPTDPEITFPHFNSDDERDHSDSDTVSTFSSISASALKEEESSPDQNIPFSLSEETRKLHESNSNVSKNSSHDSASSSSHSFLEVSTEIVNPILPSSESLLLEQTDTIQYLASAAYFITQAVQFESEKKYEESFNAYKAGISCLLTGVKDDQDAKRRQMVRHKTELYLLRAEKIYNLHLSPEMHQIRECIRKSETETTNTSYCIKRPEAELFEYKFVKIIDNGMVVLNKKEQSVFYMKVLEKNSQTPITVFINIPKDVPYMVKLFKYYDCSNSVFIVTQYIEQGRLFDYIKRKSAATNKDNVIQYSNVTFERELDQDSGNCDEIHSDSSECSYSDLISNYTSKKNNLEISSGMKRSYTDVFSSSSDKLDSHKSVSEMTDSDPTSSISDDLFLKPSSSTGDLVSKSKRIITSISDSLLQLRLKDEPVMQSKIEKKTVQRQCSEKSFSEEFSIVTYVCPLDDVIKWAAQILLAIEKLHRSEIIIIDLRPKNLLLNEDGNVLLTFIFNFQEPNNIYLHNKEEKSYIAPEVFTPQKITAAVDWWSYGVILYELLTGIPLRSVHCEINKYTLLKIPKYVCAEGKSILRKLLTYEPHNRLGCGVNGTEELKSHPFFSGVNWDRLLTLAFE